MAFKEIPSRFEAICDCCHVNSEASAAGVLPTGWGSFKFHKVGRDHAGRAVGGHKYDFILCERCSVETFHFVKKRAESANDLNRCIARALE